MLRRASTTALRRAKASIHQPHTQTATNRQLRNQQIAHLHATPTPKYGDDGFKRLPDHPPLVVEMDEDGVTPLVVVPDVELTLEWLVESPAARTHLGGAAHLLRW